jgi:hypothetical protein
MLWTDMHGEYWVNIGYKFVLLVVLLPSQV